MVRTGVSEKGQLVWYNDGLQKVKCTTNHCSKEDYKIVTHGGYEDPAHKELWLHRDDE